MDIYYPNGVGAFKSVYNSLINIPDRYWNVQIDESEVRDWVHHLGPIPIL